MTGDIDPIGTRALARTVEKIADAVLDPLRKVCVPVAEQFGLAIADQIAAWRGRNLVTSMDRLEAMLTKNKVPEGCQAHPRVANAIVEQMTWIEDPLIQDMWAGLLVSSCTDSGDDDSNLVFVTLLADMTKLQAKIINFACEKATKELSHGGFIVARDLVLKTELFCREIGCDDIQRLDRELDHLSSMSLFSPLTGGFQIYSPGTVTLTPSPLALHLYIRANGSRKSPMEFYGLTMPPNAPREATPVGPVPTYPPATQS